MNLLRRLLIWSGLFSCPGCGRGDGGGENRFCPECRAQLHFLDRRDACPKCGGPQDGVLELCSNCLDDPPPWRRAASALEYRGAVKEMISEFKSARRFQLARPLGLLTADVALELEMTCDCIVPIPATRWRNFKRTYNPAELLAQVVGERLRAPVVNALCRVKSSQKQAGLNRAQRLKNLRGVFAVRFLEAVRGRRVLLLDDVYTTGSTLRSAAAVLVKAGASQVEVLTCCRATTHRSRALDAQDFVTLDETL